VLVSFLSPDFWCFQAQLENKAQGAYMVKILHQNVNESCQASVGSPWFDSFASQQFFINSSVNVNLPGFLQWGWEISIYRKNPGHCCCFSRFSTTRKW